jgi:hypothetical protein
VGELSPGLWHWQAPHPEWRASEPWDQNVSSYAIVDDHQLLLFDPLGVPNEIEALVAEHETAIVLTAPWQSGTRRAWSSGSESPFTRRFPTARST